MKLTDKRISSLKPTTKDQFISDGGGLYVRVHTTGTKTFLARTRADGRAKWVQLGKYPTLTLADARRKANAVLSGTIDSDITVNVAYQIWIEKVRSTYKSPAQIEHRMGLHFVPALGARKLADLTRADIGALLHSVATTAPVQANRLLGSIKQFLGYCVERDWLEDSPAALITARNVGGREKARERFLLPGEIAALVAEIRSDRFAPATRLALALLLLTGQRSGEVRGIAKAEVVGGTWTLPGKRAKNGKATTIYPGPLGRRLLRAAFSELGPKPFEGMEAQVLSRACARMKFDPPFTPHDLRRTMATHMAEAGVQPHVIERCLNHTMPGVMAVYNRAAYAAECRAAWRQWERIVLRWAKEKAPEGA